jgi:class 3 adenylate cyclase
VSLRQELSLFFGGLLLVVLSLVVGLNYTSLRNTLEGKLKKAFSPQPYLQAAESEQQLLLERARTLVSNQQVNSYRRDALSSLQAAPDKSVALARARKGGDAPSKELHAELYTLYDQSLGVLRQPANDLLLETSEDGTVLLEVLGIDYESFARMDFDLSTRASDLTRLPVWQPILNQGGDLKGYLIYPDGKLYLIGATWFLKGDYFDGIALVGTAVDREFLQKVAGDNLVFVRFGGQVVGASDESQALGTRMIDHNFEEAESWSDGAGKTYLVKSEPLYSYDVEPQAQPPDAPLKAPAEIGRIVFLRDMAEVEALAIAQSRLNLLLGLAALAVALLLVPLVARRFTGPIGALSAAMKEVRDGRLEQIPEKKISSIREVRAASVAFNQMVIGLRQKKALETFVPEGTRQEVEASGGAAPELGGKRVERTILFSDLRGFTSMSERLTPTQVMEVLNLYLECMTRAIRLEGGDINEYIGDAILAVFETPDAAVRAARAMCQELDRLHDEAQVEELQGLGQGIGIHTGPIVEGNIGEKNARLKRAVVGDTVNLAARIQDRSREGKFTCIFLSGNSKARLTTDVPLEFFGDEQFKGKAEPIPVWEVLRT